MSGPESGVSVITVPLILLIFPTRRLAAAGASACCVCCPESNAKVVDTVAPSVLAAESTIATIGREALVGRLVIYLSIYMAQGRKREAFTKIYF